MSSNKSVQTNVISVRFTDAELEQLKSRSDRTGVPLSTLIRKTALADGGATNTVVNSHANANSGTPKVAMGNVNQTPSVASDQSYRLYF